MKVFLWLSISLKDIFLGSKSKQKGNAFEREVGKLLTDTLKIGEFQRTKGSGAFYGKSNQVRLKNASQSAIRAMRGDIIPPDNVELVIECKNHGNLPGGFHSILWGESKTLEGWLEEVYTDSQEGKIPNMLVFKITGTNGMIFLALDYEHFKNLPYKDYTHIVYLCSSLEFRQYMILGSWILEYKDITDAIKKVILQK